MLSYGEIMDGRTVMTVWITAWDNKRNVRNAAESYGCESRDNESRKRVRDTDKSVVWTAEESSERKNQSAAKCLTGKAEYGAPLYTLGPS